MTKMTTHLMVRSCYTLLDSTVRIPSYVQKAAEMGFRYAVLSDHNVMHGVPLFLRECRKYNIRPIVGLEADCLYHEQTVPFLLLCKDNIGYKNLMRLSSLLCTENRPGTLAELN